MEVGKAYGIEIPPSLAHPLPLYCISLFGLWTFVRYIMVLPSSGPSSHKGKFLGGCMVFCLIIILIFKFLVTPIVKRQETSFILKVKTSIWEVSKVSIIFPLFDRPIKVINCEKNKFEL
jgi:hypothetical protein